MRNVHGDRGASRFGVLLVGLALGMLGSATGSARAADVATAPKALGALEASPTPFFARIGGTAALVRSDISVSLGGHPLPGAGGRIDPVGAFYVEAGAYLTPSVTLSLSGGFPPTLVTKGTGKLAPFGTLYKATVGIPVLALAYHLDLGRLRPYAGVGVGVAIAFRNAAGAVRDPSLRDTAAPAIVAGVEYAIDRHVSAFVDVKKLFLEQSFKGLASATPGGPANIPTSARVRTDPVLVSAGLSYRF